MAPAVAEARQLGLAPAGVVFDRELGDRQFLLRGPDDHLRGELHAGRAQVQPRQHLAAQRAHAAVRIADAGAEEEVEQAREDRVADVLMQPRHRPRLDVVHAVADRHLRPVLQRRDEAGDLFEVVGQVGVGHHDVLARARPRTPRGRRCRSRACVRPRPAPPPARPGARSRPRSRCPRQPPRRAPPWPRSPRAQRSRRTRCSRPRSSTGSRPTRAGCRRPRRRGRARAEWLSGRVCSSAVGSPDATRWRGAWAASHPVITRTKAESGAEGDERCYRSGASG